MTGQVALAVQLLTGPAVEAEDNLVMAVHDQQRGRAHQAQLRPGHVGPAILAGNRRHRYPRLGGGRPQRRGRSGGCAEAADRQAARGRMPELPVGDGGQPSGERPHVESVP